MKRLLMSLDKSNRTHGHVLRQRLCHYVTPVLGDVVAIAEELEDLVRSADELVVHHHATNSLTFDRPAFEDPLPLHLFASQDFISHTSSSTSSIPCTLFFVWRC